MSSGKKTGPRHLRPRYRPHVLASIPALIGDKIDVTSIGSNSEQPSASSGLFEYASGTDLNGVLKSPVELGWETGLEPATFGATDRRSTS